LKDDVKLLIFNVCLKAQIRRTFPHSSGCLRIMTRPVRTQGATGSGHCALGGRGASAPPVGHGAWRGVLPPGRPGKGAQFATLVPVRQRQARGHEIAGRSQLVILCASAGSTHMALSVLDEFRSSVRPPDEWHGLALPGLVLRASKRVLVGGLLRLCGHAALSIIRECLPRGAGSPRWDRVELRLLEGPQPQGLTDWAVATGGRTRGGRTPKLRLPLKAYRCRGPGPPTATGPGPPTADSAQPPSPTSEVTSLESSNARIFRDDTAEATTNVAEDHNDVPQAA
jgi:hypothetical protein